MIFKKVANWSKVRALVEALSEGVDADPKDFAIAGGQSEISLCADFPDVKVKSGQINEILKAKSASKMVRKLLDAKFSKKILAESNREKLEKNNPDIMNTIYSIYKFKFRNL